MDKVLAPDVRLADIVGTLSRPKKYILGAFRNMGEARHEHGDVVLRIGTTGTGQVPHYRIDKKPTMQAFGAELSIYVSVGAFNGRNHERLVEEGAEEEILREGHWSSASMSYREVQELLGQVRGSRARA